MVGGELKFVKADLVLMPAWRLGLWILTPASLYVLTALWMASAGVGFTLASLIIRETDLALHVG